MSEPRVLQGRFERGTVLAGRYELRSVLGHGGMAEVYQGWDRMLRRRVAVKVLWEGLARDPRFLARFRREAHAVAAMAHPNIVAVFDAGSHGATPFIVMELVEGRTLADELWERAPLLAAEAIRVGRAVADALGHAHRAGIVHRDVKPGNIMLASSGEVKVLDFGIARAAAWTPVTASWALNGTAEYVSPEQVRGDPVDGRSDLYSLGAVLFETLSGRPPFVGDGPLAVAYRNLHDPPPGLRAMNPEVPEAVAKIVDTCLAKDPAHRFQRAEQLRAALDAAGGGGGAVVAASPGTPATAPRRDTHPLEPHRLPAAHRRRPSLRWGLAAAIIAVLGAAVWLTAFTPDRPAPPGPTRRPAPSTTPPPLAAPTALRAVDACDGLFSASIDLSWTPAASPTADGYEVYRSTRPGGPYEMVGLVVGRAKAGYVDVGLSTGTDYHYLVKTTGEGRRSVDGAAVSARTNGICF